MSRLRRVAISRAVHPVRWQPGEAALYTRFGGGPGEAVLPWHVEAINRMLGATMTIGTGRSARLDDRPSAGKSGTSQGYRDAWFIGFTADYVVGVWVGNDDGTPMDKVTGGSLPAKIWHDFMVEAERGKPARPLLGVDGSLPAAVATAGGAAGPCPRRRRSRRRSRPRARRSCWCRRRWSGKGAVLWAAL